MTTPTVPMRYGLVFANGDFNAGSAVAAALAPKGSCLYIAVDGGLRHLHALNLLPNLVIGDMDSADPAMLEEAAQHGAEIYHHPTHKNETDLELALIAAAERDCNVIRVIGALGDRLDQTISNVYLLALPALRGRDTRLVSGGQTTWLAFPGAVTVDGKPGDTLSLVPLAGDVVGVETTGLEYPLRHETLFFGPARGVSNVLVSTRALVTFESGVLLFVHTNGKA